MTRLAPIILDAVTNPAVPCTKWPISTAASLTGYLPSTSIARALQQGLNRRWYQYLRDQHREIPKFRPPGLIDRHDNGLGRGLKSDRKENHFMPGVLSRYFIVVSGSLIPVRLSPVSGP